MLHENQNKSISVGVEGEEIAEQFLIGKGFKIIERNVRQKFGEIDIVAKDKKGTVRFIEVKTLSAKSGLEPEDHLTRSKLGKMKKMADWYAGQNPEIVNKNYQLDLIAIKFKEEDLAVKFYENIF